MEIFAVLFVLASQFIWISASDSSQGAASQKNVMLVFIDDGGLQMGVYGNKAVKTTNIDAFANRAVLFRHGFTSVSSCSPSRSVLLTGRLAQTIVFLIRAPPTCLLAPLQTSFT